MEHTRASNPRTPTYPSAYERAMIIDYYDGDNTKEGFTRILKDQVSRIQLPGISMATKWSFNPELHDHQSTLSYDSEGTEDSIEDAITQCMEEVGLGGIELIDFGGFGPRVDRNTCFTATCNPDYGTGCRSELYATRVPYGIGVFMDRPVGIYPRSIAVFDTCLDGMMNRTMYAFPSEFALRLGVSCQFKYSLLYNGHTGSDTPPMEPRAFEKFSRKCLRKGKCLVWGFKNGRWSAFTDKNTIKFKVVLHMIVTNPTNNVVVIGAHRELFTLQSNEMEVS